jgi:hypothetical protein
MGHRPTRRPSAFIDEPGPSSRTRRNIPSFGSSPDFNNILFREEEGQDPQEGASRLQFSKIFVQEYNSIADKESRLLIYSV